MFAKLGENIFSTLQKHVFTFCTIEIVKIIHKFSIPKFKQHVYIKQITSSPLTFKLPKIVEKFKRNC